MRGLLSRAKNTNSEKLDTLIGKETVFEGNIRSQGMIRIDGHLKGRTITEGNTVIGESGRMEGEIKANDVFISGRVEGSVFAKGKIELSNTAKLLGDVETAG